MAALAAVAVKGFAMAKTAYAAIGGARTIATAASSIGQFKQGHEARKSKLRESQAYRDAAHRTMAATTRDIAEEDRKKDRMHSRAVAIAAASGGGVDDPSIVQALGELNAEGEYRVMSALWSGQNEAAGLQFRAEAARREGEAAFQIGVINAITAGYSTYQAFGGASSTVSSVPSGSSSPVPAKPKTLTVFGNPKG